MHMHAGKAWWDARLYVLVDPTLCADPVRIASQAVTGGAGIIQLRAKALDQAAYQALAAEVQRATRAAGGRFVVNDHVEVAAALAADGCHLGQDDCSVAAAREILPPGCAIGISCHSRDQVRAAQDAGADYLGLGPMYATTTKPHEPVRGPELLSQIAGAVRVPSYAIGGVTPERMPELAANLPHGIAVSSVVCAAADPTAAAAALLQALPPVSQR